MRKFIVNSFEIVLWAVLVVFVVAGTIIMPVVGTIIGLVVGTCITGFGFLLVSINSRLAEINKTLQRQPVAPMPVVAAASGASPSTASEPGSLPSGGGNEVKQCPNCKRSYTADQIGGLCTCGLRHQ